MADAGANLEMTGGGGLKRDLEAVPRYETIKLIHFSFVHRRYFGLIVACRIAKI
jgi:hypothetical protein